jgi:hypothetical protein
MTGINCDLFTHKSSPSYFNHLVHTKWWLGVVAVRRVQELYYLLRYCRLEGSVQI